MRQSGKGMQMCRHMDQNMRSALLCARRRD